MWYCVTFDDDFISLGVRLIISVSDDFTFSLQMLTQEYNKTTTSFVYNGNGNRNRKPAKNIPIGSHLSHNQMNIRQTYTKVNPLSKFKLYSGQLCKIKWAIIIVVLPKMYGLMEQLREMDNLELKAALAFIGVQAIQSIYFT